MASPRRRIRLLPGIVLVLLASLAGLEAGTRLLDRLGERPFDAEGNRAAIEQAARELADGAFLPGWTRDGTGPGAAGMQLHPYTGYEHPRTLAGIEEDLDYFATPASERDLDVLVLGGSVAFLFATLGEEPLLEALKGDPRLRERNVRIHNYALGSYKQPQQLMLLLYLLELGQAPDVVVSIDGANEAAYGWANALARAHTAYPYLPRWANVTFGRGSDWTLVDGLWALRERQRRASAFAGRLLDSGAWRSAFLSRLGLGRLGRLRADYYDAHRGLMSVLEEQARDAGLAPASAEDAVDAIVTCWEESSISLHGVCAERGIGYLHVLQPTLHDEGSKPLTPGEVAKSTAEPGWREGIRRVYPRLREAGARLAGRGVTFLDGTGLFRERTEDIYVDSCHFGEHGNRILAAFVAERLLAVIDARPAVGAEPR